MIVHLLLSSHHIGISMWGETLNVRFHVYGSDFLKNKINTGITECGAGSLASIVTMGWTVRAQNPVGMRFSARPDRPWGPPSLL